MKKVLHYFKLFPATKGLALLLFYSLRKFLNPHAKVYYSQHGEDGLIQNLVGRKNGFYIDVGCNEPVRESNTFSFYAQQGWTGINIDANVQLIRDFQGLRLADVAIHSAVSDIEGEIDFYEFHCNTVSTVNADSIEKRQEKWPLKGVKKVNARTLNNILLGFYPQGKRDIDLLTIDVEGHDFNVLRSLDLNLFTPRLIVMEIDEFDFHTVDTNEVVNYLVDYDYVLVAYDSKNGYFLRKNYNDGD